MKKSLIVCLAICIGITTAIAATAFTNTTNSDIIFGPSGTFMGAHAKDITFYNKSKKNCWFRISGVDWVYWNGTILFKRASDIEVYTDRNLKGSVWVCTRYGWNPLKGEAEYYKNKGYCYITSLKYGKAEIPAAKLVPREEYILIVELIDSSYIFYYADKEGRDYWINIGDPDTFDRVEVFGYGPISKIPYKIVVRE